MQQFLLPKNLVIGSTSQLAHYFPKDSCEFISSRGIDMYSIKQRKWDRIFICFAEQRTFLEDSSEIFTETNVDYTLKLIDRIKDCASKVVVYLTAELWNQTNSGPISMTEPFKYDKTPYIESKKLLYSKILENDFKNVISLFPVNFNSVHRKKGYLFSKIFDSIINKKKITIGNTYFYRDLVHPKFVVEQSLTAEKNMLVGSGRLTFVNDFIRDLYKHSNLDYNQYVTEDASCSLRTRRNVYYVHSNEVMYSYDNLLTDTLEDLKND